MEGWRASSRCSNSVAHLERNTANAYVHQLLVEYLATMANNPGVEADLDNRAGYDTDAAVATRLRERAGAIAHARDAGLGGSAQSTGGP